MSRYSQEETLSPYPITEQTDLPVHVQIHTLQDHCVPNLYEQFVAIDLETTGLSKDYDRIVEIGAVVFRKGGIVDTFSTLVDPGRPIPYGATCVNGITNRMLVGAPSEEIALGMFFEFLLQYANQPLFFVAHNAGFDFGFLKEACIRQKFRWHAHVFDTLRASRALLSKRYLSSYSLASLARYYGLINRHAHRAAADAEVCGELLCRLFPKTLTHPFEIEDGIEILPVDARESVICKMAEDCLVSNKLNPKSLSFVKDGKGISRILFMDFPILRYKALKTKAYFLLPLSVALKYGKACKPATKAEGKDEQYVRVEFNLSNPDLFFEDELIESACMADELSQFMQIRS